MSGPVAGSNGSIGRIAVTDCADDIGAGIIGGNGGTTLPRSRNADVGFVEDLDLDGLTNIQGGCVVSLGFMARVDYMQGGSAAANYLAVDGKIPTEIMLGGIRDGYGSRTTSNSLRWRRTRHRWIVPTIAISCREGLAVIVAL